MALAARSGNVHIIDPWPRGNSTVGTTGAEIEDAPENDASIVTVEDTADGGISITIGGDSEPEEDTGPDANFNRNLAESMDSMALAALAGHLLDGIDADIQSRRDWEDTANRAADFLGIKLVDPTTSVSADGTISKAVATTLLEAVVKIWGTHRAELLPVSGPVKVRRDDPPKPAAPPAPANDDGATGIAAPQPPSDTGDDLGLALESDLNHFLTVVDREYYPDFSKMLLSRALIGNAFRKVFRDPLKRRPASVWVKAQDLIVSNDCSHLSGAGRVTERIRMRQSVMRRMQAGGHYRDVPLVQPTGDTSPTEMAVAELEGIAASPTLPGDYEHTVYETTSELGSSTTSSWIGDLSRLDQDETGRKPGFPLPYRVSIDLDSREILEIRRAWKQGDEDYRPKKRYVKYGFVPGLGFYDLGLIHLVGNPTQAITMIQRACTDAAVLGNFPAWARLKGPGSRQQNTVLRPGPGEIVDIDAAGSQKIQDALMPFPYKDVSPQAMAMAAKLEGDVKRLAGIIELPVGEGRIGNTPVGTIMSYIEAVSQVPGAIAKDDHVAQQEEFEMLRELFAEEPETLTKGVKRPARRWQVAQELLDPELVPAADPNTPSMVHRLMKLQALVTIGGLPQFMGIADNRDIYRHAVRILAQDNPDEFELPEPPPSAAPPDPKIVAAQIKAQTEAAKGAQQLTIEQAKQQGKQSEQQQKGVQHAAELQSEEQRALIGLATAKVKATHDAGQAAADRTHELGLEVGGAVHEAQQNEADRAHEMRMQAATHQHEATQSAGEMLARGGEAEADRAHEAEQGEVQRSYESEQSAADREAAGQQHADKIGVETKKLRRPKPKAGK